MIESLNVNMNEVVGNNDILFLSLDTLRYDVAKEEYEAGNLPNLCGSGGWEKRHSPGNYTYSSHHSFFIGFLPTPVEYEPLHKRDWLFLTKKTGLKSIKGSNTFLYEGSNIIEGLEKEGYKTICIGGVVFFSKMEGVYNVFPSMFQESYWNPKFGVTNPKSAEEQVKWAIKLLDKIDRDQRVFMFINISAIHGPNYYYLEKYKGMEEKTNGKRKNSIASKLDCVESQKAALRYVDKCLEPLFNKMRERNRTFCIAVSDHGTCYGEDGYEGHIVSHDVVWNVPYRHFFL
ncbi:STM4013/SEN3800 family hydrolase [Oceanirhabdus sp. W0125-5]|uniref:STM4013/SEN3800 family hydrolase n=1 Tax=Oceanirhabdus sp. W0125-5 TaxID=2999116 RepID=UPI0022F2D018|nr:STM4013/SEN3800 family hydrolase [Oceanirhabdus sp. W0125-5]WBW98354.1 STM4013/SEN3800 family hydrolase [Oceanirhabdus sp. W0125-5]